MDTILISITIVVFAYLYGSLSNAILICKFACLPDPRTVGSNNPGTTNVLRFGSKIAAISVMILDVLKGMIPILVSYYFYLPPFWLSLVAIAACVGHIYPVFFNFDGGKGVATTLGSIAIISYDLSILMIAIWTMIVMLSGYSSLGSIVIALIAPIYIWFLKPHFIFMAVILSCLILIRHRNNIYRLWYGQEYSIWSYKKIKIQPKINKNNEY